jgi:glycosyltransferase involved in cell wall biosynthesis
MFAVSMHLQAARLISASLEYRLAPGEAIDRQKLEYARAFLLSRGESGMGEVSTGHAKAKPIQVSFVIPCFRESADVLERTVRAIEKSMAGQPRDTWEVIVVDDGTQDELYRKIVGIDQLIIHEENVGYGGSLKSGIKAARFDFIGITDADDTYPNDSFQSLIRLAPEKQMIIGARAWGSISPIRRLPKRVITRIASFIAGRDIPDLNSGMRIFHRSVYENHRRVFPDKFSFSSTLTMVALTSHYPTVFIPVTYGRRTGASKIRPFRDTVRFTLQILRLSLYFRPLRFFLPLALALLLMACGRGIRDIIVVNQFGGLSIVLFFMAFQTFFFGLLAEIISKKN